MINFNEELKKFEPLRDLDDLKSVSLNNSLTDIIDLVSDLKHQIGELGVLMAEKE